MNIYNTWLIGAGQMSLEYYKVLKSLNLKFKVIGRGFRSGSIFEKITGYTVEYGSIKKNAMKYGVPNYAIVAVSADQLKNVAKKLIDIGTANILLEKPGALSISDLKQIYYLSKKKKINIFIGYNRRFYSSVIQAKKIIKQDGGLNSIFFDFTELSNKINKLSIKKKIKDKWLISNSSHVIDLAFNFCGEPFDWSCWNKSSLNWHKSSAIFCGSGISKNDIAFSYLSDWKSAGRWGIELMTNKRKLILRPLESLTYIKKNSFNKKKIKLKSLFDKKFKPGIFLQTKAFLTNNFINLCNIKTQVINFKIYNKIANYK